jgi:hypothetical protein
MSRRGVAALGVVVTGVLAALGGVLIDELHQGWASWLVAGAAVLVSTALSAWLTLRVPGDPEGDRPSAGAVRAGRDIRGNVTTHVAGSADSVTGVTISQPISPLPGTLAARVQKALAEVTIGTFAFNPPAEMRQGKTQRVTVGITRSPGMVDELRAALGGTDEAIASPVRTSVLMSVKLRGEPAFAVEQLSEFEQPVLWSEITTWEFDVRARRPGTHLLTALVTLRIPVSEYNDIRRSVRTLERSVRVHVAPGYVAGEFARHNWQWFVATGIALSSGLAAWMKLNH